MTADDELQAAIEEARQMASAELKLSALERLRKSVLSERMVLRVLTILAIVVGVVGIGLAIYSVGLARDAGDALDAFKATRTEARLTACKADNDTATRINGLNDRTQNLLRAAVAGGDRTPEEQERVDAFLADQVAEFEAVKVPLRDCSPEGIERYYKEGTGT